jgi:acyl-coenzyme A thioesterase PaaI-like protein
MTRTRTFNWEDPKIGAAASQQLSGFEYLSAIAKGELPQSPIFVTKGFESIELVEGKVSFFMRSQEFHYNPIGVVHGGVISTILDSAMGCTVHSVLPAGVGYITLELKVNFL